MTARELARRVLRRVADGAYATLALSGELDRARALPPADRALATELVYGVLKRQLRLDYALGALAPRGLEHLDPRAREALRLGAYQILFLRVPDYAAVDDAVESIKRARGAKLAGFANALLRRLAREGEPPPPPADRLVEHLSVVTSSPPWLVERALGCFDADEARAFLESLNVPAPLWLAVNRMRVEREVAASAIAAERPQARLAPSTLLDEALRVEGADDLFRTQAYAEGWLFAQDLAAQLVAHLVDAQPGERVLDGCAGVGGKALHLAELTRDRAVITAIDRSARKLELCADHARRLGLRSVSTVVADLAGEAPLAADYDRVLLDAPCSGLGVLRRHPEAKWRPPEIESLAAVQARLLDQLAKRVRPGGVLVYAVCTFTAEEGPRQIAAFLEAHPQFRLDAPTAAPLVDLVADDGSLRTWPHRHDADAFYAARLRRIG